jgi:hypothetical protein
MDLKDLKPKSDTVEVEIVHPSTLEPLKNEDGSTMMITMYAPHSKEYKSVVHEQTNKRIKQTSKNKKLELTAEDLERSGLELLAKVTKTWNITYGGEQPKFSVDAAVDLYDEVFWIKGQIEEALTDSLDFTNP